MKAVGKIVGPKVKKVRSNNSSGADQKVIEFKGTIEYSAAALEFLGENAEGGLAFDLKPSQREMFETSAAARDREQPELGDDNGSDDDEAPRKRARRRTAQPTHIV